MEARMKNPAMLLPDATLQAILALAKESRVGGIPERTLELVHMRIGQINGCSVCLDMHAKALAKTGETVERALALAAWRESPLFNDAERAAINLAEHATRLADRGDAVPDPVWNEATRHYDEKAMAHLVLNIGLANFFNRLNATTRQIPGAVKWDH
jgi:AhpD family alkylhydroperoxidase